jgi:ComEC/Rec2-related protein
MNAILRRPLVGLSLCFIGGVWLGLTIAVRPLAILAAGGACLAAGVLAAWSRKGASCEPSLAGALPIGAAALVVGWLHAALSGGNLAEKSAAGSLAVAGQPTQMVGLIVDDPVRVDASARFPQWFFTFAADGARGGSQEDLQPCQRRIEVLLRAPRKLSGAPFYGQRWQLAGHFDDPPPSAARRARKPPRLLAGGTNSFYLSAHHGHPLVERCYAARRAAAQLLTYGIENRPEAAGIIQSLMLGYRRQMSRAAYAAFAATGTVHIFAISGSHVVVIAEILILLLMACGVARVNWILFLAPLLILFTIATGMQPSAWRACIMALVFWSAPRFHRRSDLFSSLALAAMILLAVAPADLFNLGFVLSFATVLGLALFYPLCLRPWERRLAPDPLQLPEAQRRSAPLRAVARKGAALVSASLAAWLVSAPLTAFYFNQFSPIALLGNLIALPLAFLIMLAGCLSLTLGTLSLWLADLFNHANAALVLALAWAMRWLAAVPGGHWTVAAPPVWVLAAYFLFLGLLAWTWRADRKLEKEPLFEE